jgi:beta-glucanase (GH16 family)
VLLGLIVAAALVASAPVAALGWLSLVDLLGAGTLASAQARAVQAATTPDGSPTWSDEFDGDSLDLTRWSYRATGSRHDGTLTPDAVSVGKGMLTIKTYTEAGRHYSGMISTQKHGTDGFEQMYGYFEARVKFNSAQGQWSAFWLQSPTIGSPLRDPSTAGVEMDIAEHRARCVTAFPPASPATCNADSDISNRSQRALIWDGYGADSQASVRLSDPVAGLGNDSWHTWALRWTPTDVTFYYDDTAIWSTTGPISRRSQYIILSSEVGRFFAGAIPAAGYGSRQTSTTNMQVDYVRVWANSPQGTATAPVNTARPAISGAPAVGQALTCSTGLWSGNPAPTLSYEWVSDGSPIVGASAPAYSVRSTDQGHALSCRVTAANTAGSVRAPSNALPVPATPPPTIGSSRCGTMRLLRVARRATGFRVHLRTGCRGKFSLKGTASVIIRHRRVPVVVRTRSRVVSAGVHTAVLSFAGRSPTVARARRKRQRLPVSLAIRFVPQAGGSAQTLRRQLLLGPSKHTVSRG